MVRCCIICGRELVGKQRKLCSDKECHRKWKGEYNYKYRQNNLGYGRDYYQNNQEKILKRSNDYYWNNLEKVEKYRQDNREKINKCKYEYRQNNQKKISEYHRGWRQNNPEYNRDYYQNNPEKMREYERKRYRRVRGLPEDTDLYKESSIEIIMRKWLQANNIEFVPQYYINLENSTWTWVDFYIPEVSICLYVDGDYWHSLLEVQELDIINNKILEKMGYNIIRIAETEILEGNEIWYRLAQYLEIDEYERGQ